VLCPLLGFGVDLGEPVQQLIVRQIPVAHQLIVVVIPPVEIHLAEDGPEEIVQLVVLIIVDAQRWQKVLAGKIKGLCVVRPIRTILNQMIQNGLQQLLVDCMVLANVNAN
jgi:hypothetical protein